MTTEMLKKRKIETTLRENGRESLRCANETEIQIRVTNGDKAKK